MERHEIIGVVERNQSQTRLIFMVFELFHNQIKRAIEDYSVDTKIGMKMVAGAMRELDEALGELK